MIGAQKRWVRNAPEVMGEQRVRVKTKKLTQNFEYFEFSGDWANEISQMGWFLQAMKDDEVHKIDEEFDTAVSLLDHLGSKIYGLRRKL